MYTQSQNFCTFLTVTEGLPGTSCQLHTGWAMSSSFIMHVRAIAKASSPLSLTLVRGKPT